MTRGDTQTQLSLVAEVIVFCKFCCLQNLQFCRILFVMQYKWFTPQYCSCNAILLMHACLPLSTVHDSPFDSADLASVFNKCLHTLACLAINDGLNTRFVIPSILTKCAIL